MPEAETTGARAAAPPLGPEDVLYSAGDGFCRITLNRPRVLNAMNKNVYRLLHAALERAEADSGVKAVILTGAGSSFTAGGDLQAFRNPDDAPAPTSMEVQMKVWSFPKPVIAAVRGYAVGLGSALAGVCDITIAAEDARFGEIQTRNGTSPIVMITPFLVGLKSAKELLFLGEQIDAYEAQRMGLVNRVVPGDQLDSAAEAMARRLAALPQGAMRLNKVLVNRAYELAGFREALAYRDDPAVAALASSTREDTAEHFKLLRERGWDAFLESRDAIYRDDP